MTRIRKRLMFFSVLFLVLSCSTSIKEYSGLEPIFKPEEFFNGKLVAWGTYQDQTNKVVRRFRVEMEASWQGNQGILDEDFYYDDGETQKRIWTITRKADGLYSGRADDVIGEAIGVAEGYALNWSYTMALPVDDDVYHVKFDDWMFLVDSNHVINRAKVTKYGFTIGEVTLFIQKLE